MNLEGRVAIVTGATGGGVGTAIARLLAAGGAAVVVNYAHSQERAEAVVADIASAGGRALASRAEVGDRESVQRMVDETMKAFGRVDILVSNVSADVGNRLGFGRIADLSWEQFVPGFTGRVNAALILTQAVLPLMRQQNSGRLIFIGSDHAEGPAAPGMVINGTSAAALVAFARYAAHELGQFSITANVVSPSMVDSETTARVSFLPPQMREMVIRATPMGRLSTPDDIAHVVAFFASKESEMMTGTVAHVNGGFGIARLAIPPAGQPSVPASKPS